jgi:hypothetical protein
MHMYVSRKLVQSMPKGGFLYYHTALVKEAAYYLLRRQAINLITSPEGQSEANRREFAYIYNKR